MSTSPSECRIESKPKNWVLTILRSFASSTGIVLVGLLTGILLARLLGPEGRGVVGIVVTYATVIVGFGQLSVGDVAVIQEKEIGEDRALATAWTVSMGGFVIATPILGAFLWAMLREHSAVPLGLSMAFFAAFAVSNTINQLYLGVFRIRHQFGKVQIYALTKPLVYFGFLLLLAIGAFDQTVEMILIALIASNLVAVGVRALRDGLPFIAPLDWKFSRAFLKLAMPLYTTKVVQTLGAQGDRLLAASLLSADEIGIFLVATTFASVIPGIYSTAVKLLVLPAMVSIDHDERGAQAVQILRMTWAASIAAGAFTAAVAHFLIPLLFGEDYSSASGMAVCLAIANLPRPVRESLLEVQKSYAVGRFFALPMMTLFVAFVVVAIATFSWLGVYGIIAGRGVAELVTIVVLSKRLQAHAPEIAIRHWVAPQFQDFKMLVSLPWAATIGRFRNVKYAPR